MPIASSPFTNAQFYGLQAETEATVTLSQRGIEELWALGPGNDFLHLPLQLLAQGFERLLKLTYALAWMKQHGVLPEAQMFRRDFGHRVDQLTDELVKLVETQPEYVNRQAVQEDRGQADDRNDRRLPLPPRPGVGHRTVATPTWLAVVPMDVADGVRR